MICVITNLTRNFCLALLPQYRDFGVIDSDTSGPPSKKKSSKTESSIEQEGSSFSSWAILTSRTSSNFFRSQSICRMLTIFHMLSHLESNFSHSFVHLARRCHLGSHFVTNDVMLQDFPYLGDHLLRPDPPFWRQGYASTDCWKLSSRICASVSRRTSAWCCCTEWLALACNTKDVKTNYVFEKWMLQQSCWIISWSVFSFKSDFSKVDGPNLISLDKAPLYSIARNVFSLMFCAV